jgi:hypothetical protein
MIGRRDPSSGSVIRPSSVSTGPFRVHRFWPVKMNQYATTAPNTGIFHGTLRNGSGSVPGTKYSM